MSQAGEKQNARIWRRDKFKCAYCDLDMSTEANSVFLVSDHIDPRKKKKDDYDEKFDINKITSCVACNSSFKLRYIPKGNTRKEQIRDAREYVKKKREEHFKWFREVKTDKI